MALGSGLCLFRSRGRGAGVRSSWGWMFQFFGFHCTNTIINKKSSIPIIGWGLFDGFGSKLLVYHLLVNESPFASCFGCSLGGSLVLSTIFNHHPSGSKWQAPAVVRRLEFPYRLIKIHFISYIYIYYMAIYIYIYYMAIYIYIYFIYIIYIYICIFCRLRKGALAAALRLNSKWEIKCLLPCKIMA